MIEFDIAEKKIQQNHKQLLPPQPCPIILYQQLYINTCKNVQRVADYLNRQVKAEPC